MFKYDIGSMDLSCKKKSKQLCTSPTRAQSSSANMFRWTTTIPSHILICSLTAVINSQCST